jgi:hypothetical protein
MIPANKKTMCQALDALIVFMAALHFLNVWGNVLFCHGQALYACLHT